MRCTVARADRRFVAATAVLVSFASVRCGGRVTTAPNAGDAAPGGGDAALDAGLSPGPDASAEGTSDASAELDGYGGAPDAVDGCAVNFGHLCQKGFTLCPPGELGLACNYDPGACDPTLDCSAPTTDPSGTLYYCCTGHGYTGSWEGGEPPCFASDAIGCAGSGAGYACALGVDPEAVYPGQACTAPSASGNINLFCCLDWDTSAGCTPDINLTTECSDPLEYAFHCTGSATPPQTAPALSCGTPTPDATGIDYCCGF